MKRVSPAVAALAVATSLTMVVLSSVTAFADAEHANPDNNGHHYGWVKHHNNQPPPAT